MHIVEAQLQVFETLTLTLPLHDTVFQLEVLFILFFAPI